MSKILLLIVCLFCFSISWSQKVGLVLSGGAAKGLAHIGVIKALEEHEIPIDYVVGTSMGAIIGAAYAAGMSAAEIEELFTSSVFQNWINGKPEEGYTFYYQDPDQSPSLVKLNLKVDSTLNLVIKQSLASDAAINFALAEFLAQPSAIADYDFDKLFVPARFVASDIFRQTQVVLSKGQLNEAVRASQSVPLFYAPVKVEGRYLFDGGIYNNFPVDVAIAEFNPDVIIGVNVSTRKYDDYPFESDDRLISNELFLMLIDKADPAKIPDGGFYIEPNLSAYTGFDFSKVNQLIDSGYVATIVQIEEIKSSIKRRVSCEEITNARNDFNIRKKPLQFGNIRYEGFNKRQRAYINNLFAIDEKPLSLHEVKTGYFKLVAEDYFKSIYPTVNYNKDSESYDLTLSQRPGNNTKIDFGGNLSTRNISNMFLGLNYYHFSNFLFHANAEFYAGNFYKSVQVKTQFDLPYLGRFYIEPEAVVNVWDFLESDDLILFDRLPTALERIDRRLGVNIGHAVKDKYKLTYAVHGIYNTDRFINSTVLSSLDVYDRLNLSGLRTQINFSKYDLNRKQYASKGRNFNLNLSYFDVHENLVPGTTSVFDNEITNNHKWFRARLNYEQYFKSRTFYTPGILVEALVSNQPVFSSYKASLISAPGFYPLQDSRTIFLENFRAYNYVAMGTRNVFNIRKSLDFRFEAYVFRPIEAIREGQNQRPVLFSSEKDFHFAASGNLVFHSAIGPISLSANYYDDNENRFGLLLHVGFLLFNRASMD